MLAGQDGINALFHEPLSSSGHRGCTGVEGCRNLAVIPGLASLRGVGLQQNARLQQLSRWMVALLDQFVKPFAFLVAEVSRRTSLPPTPQPRIVPACRYGAIDLDVSPRVKDAGH